MISKINQPNLIIANAGITKYGGIGSISKNDRESLFYLLCHGVIDLLEEYIPSMIHRGEGRIVIISSIGAITPMPKSSIYASAKSAIYSYGQSLSKELSNKNISCGTYPMLFCHSLKSSLIMIVSSKSKSSFLFSINLT